MLELQCVVIAWAMEWTDRKLGMVCTFTSSTLWLIIRRAKKDISSIKVMKFWMWRGWFLLPWCPFEKMTTATDWDGSVVSCQIVTAVVMNIPVFWNVMSCGLVYRYQWFRGTCCLHLQDALLDFLEDGDKKVFRNICCCVISPKMICQGTTAPPPTKFWCLANSAAGRPVIRWIQQRLSLRALRDWVFKLDLEKVHVKEKPLRDMSLSVVQYGPLKHLLDETDCPLPTSMCRI